MKVRAGAAICLWALVGCSSAYEGERINALPWSLPHGTGSYTSPEGWTYMGEWRKGRREGLGTCRYEDGSKYTGEWLDDRRHGRGTFTWPDGLSLEGFWENDHLVRMVR